MIASGCRPNALERFLCLFKLGGYTNNNEPTCIHTCKFELTTFT